MAYCQYLPVAFLLRRNMKRSIGKRVVLFVLILLCLFLVLAGYFSDHKDQKELLVLQKKYEQQDKDIREIRDQLSQKRNEWKNIKPKAFVILAFSEENQQLMENIKPEMEKRNLAGTIVVKNRGHISKERIEEWTNAGWDIAFGGEIGKQKVQREQFLADFQKLSEECKAYGLHAPLGFFFNGGEASYGKRMLYPLMEQYSYSVAVMFAQNENRLNYSVNQEFGELKECQNISLRGGYEEINILLEQAKVQNIPIVFSDFGEKNQMEISQEEPVEELTKILDLIHEAHIAGDLEVGSIREYIDYLSEVEEEKKKAQEEYRIYEQENEEKRKTIYNTYE